VLLRVLFTFFIISFLLPANSYAAYSPNLKWHTIETKHFLIHYHTGLKSAANEVATQTKDVHDEVTTFFNWVPKAKTHIVISDQIEKPNGSASVLPYNRIELFMSPPADVNGLEDYKNWKRLVLKHEYVHIVHLDKSADLALDGRSILGRIFLFFPNTFLPRWISEGIATFRETDNALKIGRGQSSYYRGLMRNEVMHGIKSLNQINQPRTQWPTNTGFYLYGVYFFNFIRDTYGEQKIAEFVENYSHFPIPYFINTVTKETFGKNTFVLWDEFEIYLKNEFNDEILIEKRRQEALNKTPLTDTGYSSGFSQISNGKLYFIRSDREKLKELVEKDITSNKERIITKIIRQDYVFPQSFDVNANKGILIPLLETYENSRESFDLFSVDIHTGIRTRLTKNKRYFRGTWNAGGDKIVAVGNHNGTHNLDLLDQNGEILERLWQGKPGVTINAIDWSPVNNNLIVSMFTPDKGWNLYLFDISQKSWRKMTDNAAIETYPQFNEDGTHVIYSADYDNVYNSYQLAIDTKNITKLSDSSTIILFPTLDKKNNRIYYTELDKNGFNLKKSIPEQTLINTDYLRAQTFQFDQEPTYDQQTTSKPESVYKGIKYLAPPWWLPAYVSDENQLSMGFLSRTNDPLYWHNYNMLLLYDIKNYEFRWNINYTNKQNWVYYTINSRQQSFNSDFLERRESETTVALLLPYVKQKQQWGFFAAFQHLETRISPPRSNFSLRGSDSVSTLGISFDSTSYNLRSAAPHNGMMVNASYELSQVITSIKQRSRITLDVGLFSAPLKSLIIQASGILISAGGNASPTYLGGTQSDGTAEVFFGKSTYRLRGYAPNQFIGTNMQKASLQLHYPLFYPETGFMRIPIGVDRLKLNAIAESARVGTFNNIYSQTWLSSVALELSAKASFGFGRWPLDFYAGIAKGLNETGEIQIYNNMGINF